METDSLLQLVLLGSFEAGAPVLPKAPLNLPLYVGGRVVPKVFNNCTVENSKHQYHKLCTCDNINGRKVVLKNGSSCGQSPLQLQCRPIQTWEQIQTSNKQTEAYKHGFWMNFTHS